MAPKKGHPMKTKPSEKAYSTKGTSKVFHRKGHDIKIVPYGRGLKCVIFQKHK